MTIVIVDTSILLNILAVPGKAQNRDAVRRELEDLVKAPKTELLLPLVALVETGNHIAQLSDGGLRRKCGEQLVEIARKAFRREAVWTLVPFPEPDDLEAMPESLVGHLVNELGFADASMVAIWDRQRKLWPTRRVRIWSLDGQLSAYDHRP